MSAARPPAPTFLDPRVGLAIRLVRKLVHFYPDRPARQLVSLARRPGDVRALVSLLRSLPSTTAEVPAPVADAFAARLGRGPRLMFGQAEPHAVLHLADTLEENLRGKSRQALRTNVRRARSLGVVATDVTDDNRPELNRQAQARLAASHRPVTVGPCHGHQDQLEVATFAADGTLLVVATASCFGPWAVLEMFMRFSDLPETSVARYLTHMQLIERLLAAGVRHLVSEETLRKPDSFRHQYHILGFRLTRAVIPVGTLAGPPPPPKPG